MAVIVGSLYAMETLRFVPLLTLLGGADQKGRLRKPGRRKSEGDGRYALVFARRDGPWITTAASGGGTLEDCDEKGVEV